ncbi:hypothetical protein AB71_1927 [Escherichia coli 1-182-04_S1_C3]|nr:hypothetical protein AB71_1927 [Escherichia coli 1-182-04_S1_C3]
MSKLRLFFKVKTVITFEITLKTGGLGCNVHRYLAKKGGEKTRRMKV